MSNIVKQFNPITAAAELAIDGLPYASTVRGALSYFQTTRVHLFLTNLSESEEHLTEEEVAKLRNFIDSPTGYELLAEFVENAISTSSKTASIALALVYSRCASESIDDEEARFVCSALREIDEYLVNKFILLFDRPETDEQDPGYADPPYKITILSKEKIEKSPELKNQINPEETFSIINELIRRRLFLPDYTFDRATPAHWTCIYGVNKKSKLVRDLLIIAKDILHDVV